MNLALPVHPHSGVLFELTPWRRTTCWTTSAIAAARSDMACARPVEPPSNLERQSHFGKGHISPNSWSLARTSQHAGTLLEGCRKDGFSPAEIAAAARCSSRTTRPPAIKIGGLSEAAGKRHPEEPQAVPFASLRAGSE
jgi:hypothetical protein